MQVGLGPACELPAIAITLPPEMKGRANAGPNLVEVDDWRKGCPVNLAEIARVLRLRREQSTVLATVLFAASRP